MRWYKQDLSTPADPAIKKLRRKHGIAGFGRYQMLCLLVYNNGGPLDVTDPDTYDMLMDELELCDEDGEGVSVCAFLADLAKWGLLNPVSWERHHVISDRMAEEIARDGELSEKRRKGGIASGAARQK